MVQQFQINYCREFVSFSYLSNSELRRMKIILSFVPLKVFLQPGLRPKRGTFDKYSTTSILQEDEAHGREIFYTFC
jgi:hypothetical protein